MPFRKALSATRSPIGNLLLGETSNRGEVTANGETGGSNRTKTPVNPHITDVSPYQNCIFAL